MIIDKKPYGVMPDGTQIYEITMTGAGGLSVSLINYGGTITKILFSGKDVALGYDRLEDYVEDKISIGVTVGRFANRIDKGKFTLGGSVYNVGCNEPGRGHLHGGKIGFQKRVFDICDTSENGVIIHYHSPDGEMGYPAALDTYVTFFVTDDNALEIKYKATSDADTVLNLTNHTFFNLDGYDGEDVLDTELYINSDSILPVDEMLIPTGEELDITGTPFDFRTPKTIRQDIGKEHEQLKVCGGYDHNYCLSKSGEVRHAITAYCKSSGITMDCYTDRPGVQLYTGNFLESKKGKGGAMRKYQGFCLETQTYPNSPNEPLFPTPVLKRGETFQSTTIYKFSK